MSLVMQAVQQALVSKLTGDATLMDRISAVYDSVPQGSTLPYLVIDDVAQEILASIGENVWRVSVALEIWSDASGRKTALLALERLHAMLHNGTLTMDDFTLREMRVEQASCVIAEQATRIVGSMELSLIVAED